MRIQIFVQSLSVGGAERVAAMWANGFVGEGHKVSVVLYQPLNFPRTYDVDKRVEISSIHSEAKGKWRNFIGRFKRTGIKIKEFKPDVILTVYHVQDLAIWFYTRRKRTKIISTEHNSFERPAYAPMGRRDYILKFYANKLFDAVTVLTTADTQYIGNRLKNVYVLPNPLAFNTRPVIQKREKVVLAVGRLDVYFVKGFDLLISAWSRVAGRFPDWKLKIVGSSNGDSTALTTLQDLAKKNGVEDCVEFLPYRKELLPLYQTSEVFVLSSRYEGFGLVLLEAMSQGCACIACDYHGRQREIIFASQYGIICKTNSLDSLVEALDKMMSDEKYRNEIQQNAPKRAEHFNLSSIMDKWNGIFSDLIPARI